MTQTSNQVAVQQQKNITDQVLSKIDTFKQSGELYLPKDYSPENALKAAYLVLLETKTKDNKPVLEACTKESIANSLLKMVVWGLSPLKKQGDFIAYGNELSFSPEYTGNIALAKRYGGLVNYKGNAIFKGDVFSFNVNEDGRRSLIEHKQSLESFGGEVIGAYMTYELADGTKDMEVMNISQIRAAWNQGAMKGGSPAHKNFTDQMAIKSVINRACKLLIRASNDAPLMSDVDKEEQTDVPNRKEIPENNNVQEIGFEEVEDEKVSDEKDSIQPSEPQEKKQPVQTEMPY